MKEKCDKENRIRFCELREKEVINTCNGRRLGCVTDIILDKCSGTVEAVIVPGLSIKAAELGAKILPAGAIIPMVSHQQKKKI